MKSFGQTLKKYAIITVNFMIFIKKTQNRKTTETVKAEYLLSVHTHTTVWSYSAELLVLIMQRSSWDSYCKLLLIYWTNVLQKNLVHGEMFLVHLSQGRSLLNLHICLIYHRNETHNII